MSAPPAPPTPLGGVAGGRASSLRELTSPTHRLRGAASGGITSSPTWKSGNWWQHGLTPKSERRCWKVPLGLDVGLKKPLAGTNSNTCMVPKSLQKVGRDGRGPHLWLCTGASSLRELTSHTHRLRGAASGGITSSQTWKSGNWWQHGLTPKSERRCWKVPHRLDVGLKKPLARTDSNSCMVSNTLQKVARDGRGPHRWLRTVAQRFTTPFQMQQKLFLPRSSLILS
jgi:hypothetical protein